MDKLLLNVCCAPCGLPLLNESESSTLHFYNPNIFPPEEYSKRLVETRKIAALFNLPLVEDDYDHEAWLEFVKGKLSRPPEDYQEDGERCRACYEFRLEQTARYAKANNFKSFAATLSVSRFKDIRFINRLGQELAKKYSLDYKTFTLDANEAYRIGLELSKKHGIYRQKYCGCEFSLKK